MFKILYQLDELDNIEANVVAEAANRLGVGEFQLFQLAHTAWHGREVDPHQIEAVFFDYMLHDRVPHWVRQFARNVIRSDDDGALDPDAAEYHRFDRSGEPSPGRITGISKVVAVVVLTAVFMALIVYAYHPQVGQEGSCYFPPCPWMY